MNDETPIVQSKNPEGRKELWVACSFCNRETSHKVLAEFEWTFPTIEHEPQFWKNYLTILCQGCKTLSFCLESRDTESWDYDRNGNPVPVVERELFPRRLAGRPPLKNARFLSEHIFGIYKETHDALCNRQPVLTGLGIRAIVEAVCKEKVGDQGDLKKKIDRLAAAGLVSPDQAKLLHELRFMGNYAAHEVKVHSAGELDLAFDVVEHLLQGGYLLSAAADLQKNPFGG
jgi:hypothetical protein